jgi:hypothetical protein
MTFRLYRGVRQSSLEDLVEVHGIGSRRIRILVEIGIVIGRGRGRGSWITVIAMQIQVHFAQERIHANAREIKKESTK